MKHITQKEHADLLITHGFLRNWAAHPSTKEAELSELEKIQLMSDAHKEGTSVLEVLVDLWRQEGEDEDYILRALNILARSGGVLLNTHSAAMRKAILEARVFELPLATYLKVWDHCHQSHRSYLRGLAREDLGDEKRSKEVMEVLDRVVYVNQVDTKAPGMMGEVADEKIGMRRLLSHPIVYKSVEGLKEGDNEVMHYLTELDENSKSLPLPEHLPFDSCLFMPARAMPLDRVTAQRLHFLGLGTPYHVGFLISREICVDVCGSVPPEKGSISFFPYTIWYEDEWLDTNLSFGPWMADSLVRMVNWHKKIIVERPRSMADSLHLKKMKRKWGFRIPPPSPFYIVDIDEQYLDEHKKSIFPPTERRWSHRWDVRGTEVVRYAGEKLPLSPARKANLLQRKYKVFEDPRLLDTETLRLLDERPKIARPKPGEWFAILSFWRNPHIKGPEGKPYIPSVHRMNDGLAALVKESE